MSGDQTESTTLSVCPACGPIHMITATECWCDDCGDFHEPPVTIYNDGMDAWENDADGWRKP